MQKKNSRQSSQRGEDWREVVKIIAAKFNKSELMQQYVIDKTNEKVLEQLYLYFTDDKKFDGRLDAGIALIGTVGTGKTLMLKIFNYFARVKQNKTFGIFSSRDVVIEYNSTGDTVIKSHINSYKTDGLKKIPLHRLYDDIGIEPDGHYYKPMNVMEHICCGRWDKDSRLVTHITSNLGLDELKERYGVRFTSRLQQHTNCFMLEGSDRRIK